MTDYEKYCEEHGLCQFCQGDMAEFSVLPQDTEDYLINHDLDCGALGEMSIYASIHNGSLEVGALGMDGGDDIFQEAVKIKYCPMCGRQLTKGEEA